MDKVEIFKRYLNNLVENGEYEKDSINYLVSEKLKKYAEINKKD